MYITWWCDLFIYRLRAEKKQENRERRQYATSKKPDSMSTVIYFLEFVFQQVERTVLE